MAFNFKEAVKKPWMKVALGVILFFGIFIILRSRSGSGATGSSGPSDAQVQALAQEQMQQNALEYQSSAQQASLAASAAAQAQHDQTGLAAQKESDATQLSLAGIQLQGLFKQLETQQTMNSDALSTQVALANVTANEQTGLAQITANQQGHLADLQADVANHQSDNATKVAVTNSNNQANVAITQSNNSSGGGCFITTAVCERDEKPDDCDELETLRTFRDTFMRATPERSAMVDLYYSVAPIILDRIEAFPDDAKSEVFAVLRTYVALAVKAASDGQNERAARIYINMMGYVSGVAK